MGTEISSIFLLEIVKAAIFERMFSKQKFIPLIILKNLVQVTDFFLMPKMVTWQSYRFEHVLSELYFLLRRVRHFGVFWLICVAAVRLEDIKIINGVRTER